MVRSAPELFPAAPSRNVVSLCCNPVRAELAAREKKAKALGISLRLG